MMNAEEDWIIESIIKKRKRQDDLSRFSSPVQEYFIKWVGYTSEHNSWHSEDELHDMGVTNFKEKYAIFLSKVNAAIKKKNQLHLILPDGRKRSRIRKFLLRKICE